MLNFEERVYWNNNSYGNAFRVKKHWLHAFNLFLGVAIPIIYPVPIAAGINKLFIKNDLIVRYD